MNTQNRSAEQTNMSKGRGYDFTVKIQGLLETQIQCLQEVK